MSNTDTAKMTVTDYLEWFEKNLPVVNSISATDFDFMVFLDGRRWDAGYSCMFDYEGSHFLKSMKGIGDSVLGARMRLQLIKSRMPFLTNSTVLAMATLH